MEMLLVCWHPSVVIALLGGFLDTKQKHNAVLENLFRFYLVVKNICFWCPLVDLCIAVKS
ncbi:hypothetical protein SLEP1_g49854 [Rubroshorea leprosula]|uniref:Uncharacterized protein n=1 Tax=Rubroshorea leprosula TaxID=152421 RepID=A0AAV5LYX3_9ROSI|nr:hypothetical protein SLEP1_g49854 [Rubroshorea leprosula]